MKSLIDITPEHLVLLQSILQTYLPKNASVFVFGSRAKFTAKPFSDLDLAIDIGRPLSLTETAKLRDDFEESILPYKVDIVDWYTINEDFKELIKKDCIKILPQVLRE